jgi:hypothetical protein
LKRQNLAKNDIISVTARVTSAEISGFDASPRVKKPCCIEGKSIVAEPAGRAAMNDPPAMCVKGVKSEFGMPLGRVVEQTFAIFVRVPDSWHQKRGAFDGFKYAKGIAFIDHFLKIDRGMRGSGTDKIRSKFRIRCDLRHGPSSPTNTDTCNTFGPSANQVLQTWGYGLLKLEGKGKWIAGVLKCESVAYLGNRSKFCSNISPNLEEIS